MTCNNSFMILYDQSQLLKKKHTK